MNFILVAKPGDHPHLQEQLVGLRLAEGVTTLEKAGTGKISQRRLEIAHDVPLFASTNGVAHWLEYSERTTRGKAGYHNGWVISIKPTAKNALELVTAGRHRFSIENQTYNALKNQGHHFEQNFGHGRKHLRFNFAVLNLLAFLMHQLLSVGDALCREAKTWKKTVRELYEHIRMAIRLTMWPDWPTLMNHYLDRGPRLRIESG